MVFISVSATAPVNSPLSSPKLSINDLYAALVYKARYPKDFVAPIESSSVIHEHADGLTRKVMFKAGTMGKLEKQEVEEVVDFYPPTRVDFHVPATGMRVSNIISYASEDTENEEELYLTFSFDFPHPEITDREKQKQEAEEILERHRKGSAKVVPHTIEIARQMKAEGRL
ncbi:hypothetical protein BGW36DRAFT_406988 [Talaromyces proteolyticus]|uniref:Uncharacterized protein n=1 Tax=Talaromyces proteolyticus TaxID=1131652 RepID=A0AAD4KTU8_9EURO|nr:uncharacterized protein BGW36DRAFT_406988 [Talaromyces proteolyticus]KAH8699166.1 hypothetical protein BGW36DRAFT_406988 [Talaromyces proteolyticus]